MLIDHRRTLTASLLVVATSSALAQGAANAGVERAKGGAIDMFRSPLRVVEGVQQDTAMHGAVGVVTGTVKGGAQAAIQVVNGALNIGVGTVEAIAAPLSKNP